MSTGSSSEALGPRVDVRVGSIVVRCVRFDELVAFWRAAPLLKTAKLGMLLAAVLVYILYLR